jgi:phosphatidate cytidylyltransferase
VDDRDEFESEPEDRVEPVTERVRIIGAQPAGGASAPGGESDAQPGSVTVPGGFETPRLPSFGEAGDEPVDLAGDVPEPGPAELGATRSARNGGDPLEPGTQVLRVDPVVSVPDMPHWTDPPTGQVPAVIDRRGDDEDADQWSAASDPGPAWREHRHEWDDSTFDPSLLADEETRVGALEETPVEERRPWEFDDLTVAGTTGRAEDVADTADRGASWWDEGDETDSDADAGAVERAGESSPPGASESDDSAVAISSSPLRISAREPSAAGPLSPPSPRPVAPATSGSGQGTGRNLPVAIATGLGFALLAVVCFEIGTVATLVLVTVVVALAAAECYAALRHSGRRPATFPGLVATVMVMIAVYTKGIAAVPLVVVLMLVTSMIWYLVGAERGSAVEGVASTVFAFVWIGILGSFAALMLSPSQYPQRHGIAFLLGAIVAAIGADVGALAVGSWLGRHQLAPRVSPGKTWEGLIGGAALAIALSAAVTGQVHPWTVPKAALLGVVAAVVAPLGDLCESLIKRDLGLKDMGSILPGHGGVLDRVDAILFVLPATYYLVRVLNLG